MHIAQKQVRGFWFHVLDVLYNVIIIVVAVGVIRIFLVSPFQIEGNSMLDTLKDRQYIIIDKFSYRFVRDPMRGDVVVFRPPTDPKRHYVKRIIGLPEDEVIIRDGYVFLADDDQLLKLDEEYLNSHNQSRTFRSPVSGGDTNEERYRVPEGSYFLLGDNRQSSFDSRSFRSSDLENAMYVPRKNIAGRVWIVALPITKIHALELPEYGL
jgi:signal peptidase I